MKIGFVGGGNMATAIIKGMTDSGYVKPADIFVYDIAVDKMRALASEVGFTPCASSREVVETADVIILAVKPQILPDVLIELREPIVSGNKLVVSIAAGTSIEKLHNALSDEISVIRVMPNVNLMAGQGAAAVCGNARASRDQIEFVLGIFRSAGTAVELDEKFFSVFTAIAGSSPAYAYLFIDSMARAAVKHGLPKDIATEIAAQAVLGSAAMVLKSAECPWSLIDKVCSPGGTTVAGLLALEEEKFLSTVVKGIDATIARDKELSAGK